MPTAATNPFVGKGTTLGYSIAATGPFTYTTIAQVTSVSPNITVGEVENITLASLFKSYLPTLPEAECDFTIKHVPGDTGVQEVLSLVGTGAIVHWQVLLPDTVSKITFDGFVKGYNPSFENESVVEADCSMRITTMPTFA